MRQSLQELRMLSKYRHDNILPLYAYSLDGPQPCLFYQYMSNGSLFDCLFKKVRFYGFIQSLMDTAKSHYSFIVVRI